METNIENKILTKDGWQDRIRDKMGVDEVYLPNSTIEQPDIIDIAETSVINRIPGYKEIDSDTSKLLLENAVVIKSCILLCTGMEARLPKKQAGPHESHELNTDWMRLRDILQEELDGAINNIIEEEFPELASQCISGFTISFPHREWEHGIR